MKNPGLPDALWTELSGGLWHATRPDRLADIAKDGAIRPGVKPMYAGAYVLSKGGVSLFELGADAVEHEHYFHSNWSNFYSASDAGRIAVWLKIDRASVAEALTAPKALIENWNVEGPPRRKVTPGVECMHAGPVPTSAITGATLIDGHQIARCMRVVGPISGIIGAVPVFSASLPPPPPDHPITAALKRARR